MLHILMVSSEYPPYVDDKSGLGTHTWTLAHALTRAGCRVLVVTYGDGEGGLKTDGEVSIFLASGGNFPAPGRSLGQTDFMKPFYSPTATAASTRPIRSR